MKYFIPMPETLEQLKKTYRKLAQKFHPDAGGSDEAMKAINAEYTVLFEKLKYVHTNTDGETYHKDTNETSEQIIDIINKLIHMDGVTIEIIGSFVWVSDNTKPYKDILKEMNFRWSANKSSWYLAPTDYKKRNRKNYSLDDIRGMYGSREIETKPFRKVSTAI
jgi:curved DNA-binding protein CbpA